MTLQLTKSTLDYNINRLPDVLKNMIFYYIPLEILLSNETKLIKNVIGVYNIDHEDDLTRQYGLYYIKNIMGFQEYVFWALHENNEELVCNMNYGLDYGVREFDRIELDTLIKYKIEKNYKKLY
jgi:hypothetical protein